MHALILILTELLVLSLVLAPSVTRAGVRRARARMLILHSNDADMLHRLHGPHEKDGQPRWYHSWLNCRCHGC